MSKKEEEVGKKKKERERRRRTIRRTRTRRTRTRTRKKKKKEETNKEKRRGTIQEENQDVPVSCKTTKSTSTMRSSASERKVYCNDGCMLLNKRLTIGERRMGGRERKKKNKNRKKGPSGPTAKRSLSSPNNLR